MEKPKIFISYSHKDSKLVNELKTQLLSMRDGIDLDLWDDSLIPLGKSFRDRILVALNQASVGVVMVSPDFLSSRFIREVELPQLLSATRTDELTICLVHVRASLFDLHPSLGALQSVNSPQQPLQGMKKLRREREWVAISRSILQAVQERGLRAGASRDAAAAYETLAAKLRLYCLKALDLKSAFQFVGQSAQHSEGDLEELNAVIRKYNEIAEDLLTRGRSYVLAVSRNLPPDLDAELRELMPFALDEIHRAYAFQLNEARVTINHLKRGEIPADKVEAVAAQVQKDMQPFIRGLADKVPVLERRVDRLSEKIASL